MNVQQTASYIGVSTSQVRWLIRNKKLKARKVKSRNNQFGYEYTINRKAAGPHRNKPEGGRGRPRKTHAR